MAGSVPVPGPAWTAAPLAAGPETPADPQLVLAVIAQDVVDAIRDQDGAALDAAAVRVARLAEGDRLAQGAGNRASRLLAMAQVCA